MSEHHSTPLNITPSPSVFLAAVTQRTKRIRLGALVYVLPTHHPLRLAEEICMLDHLSRGRIEVGVGRGASPHELHYFGVDSEQSPAMYVEAYDVIKQALTQAESISRANIFGSKTCRSRSGRRSFRIHRSGMRCLCPKARRGPRKTGSTWCAADRTAGA